jgi:hypothetical protein
MAERKVSVRLAVVDGGQFKAELAELGAAGNQALGAIGAGASTAGNAVRLNAQQLGNLQFQLQDIGVSLASGQNPFTVMLQQGSQIVQLFGPGTGVLGAIRAVGTGLLTFLTNPLNLALLGFSAVTAAAGYLFSTITGDGEDANKTLEEQENIVKRIAERYGEALPHVQAYVAELDRAEQSADLASARTTVLQKAWEDAAKTFADAQYQVQILAADLQHATEPEQLHELIEALGRLDSKLGDNTATAADATRVHDALMKLFRETGVPVTKELAGSFQQLAASIAQAAGEAAAINQEFAANVAAQGVLSSLNAELEALGKTTEQLRIEKELRKANVDAASDEGKAIAAKVHEIIGETEARKEQAASERAAASARRAADTRAAAEAQRARKAVSDLLGDLNQSIDQFGNERAKFIEGFLSRLPDGATEAQRAEVMRLAQSLYELEGAEKDATKAAREGEKARGEGEQVYESTRTVAEHYAETLADLNRLLAAGAIDQETYGRAVARAREQMEAAAAVERKRALESGGIFGPSIAMLEDFVEKAGEAADLIKEALSEAFSVAEEAVGQFVRTGKVDFASLISSMLADLARLAVKQAILGPLANILGGLLGGTSGGIGSILSSIYHDGGMAGGGAPMRSVPALAFAGAPRLHGGGMFAPDEIPAILQRGERVLNRRETREYGQARAININIATPDIQNFRRARTQVAADIARAVSSGSRGL